MIAARRACRATRAVIVDIVEAWASSPGAVGPSDERLARALTHARHCDECRAVIEAAVLVDRRLRRYARGVRRAPLPDVWLRLRPRVGRRGRAGWRWRLGLAGLLASAALVGLVVGPRAALRPAAATLQEIGVEAARIAARRFEEEQREAAVLAGQLRVRSLPPPARPPTGPRPDPRTEADGTPRWSGPDGLGFAGRADRLVAERSGLAGPVEPRTS